ncbi:hypothetical protein AYO29_03595 [Coxiella burnetii str. Schperling]|nr:hypothetical protein AYO29_03595 [Coxiella burnetii str. Schperling]
MKKSPSFPCVGRLPTNKESRAFTAEVTGIQAKRGLKNANGVFLSILVWIPRLGREGFVFFNTTADGLAGGRRVLKFFTLHHGWE